MPGSGATLDAYGNMSSGQLHQLLSALGVLRGTKGPDGIYLRVERKAGPIQIFVRLVSYRPPFPYYSKAREVIPRAFKRPFRDGWDRFAAP